MKIVVEPEDIQAIAEKLVDLLKPYISKIDNKRHENSVLDVSGLCEYLKVTPKWVYEQTHLKTIPHYKLSGKALRFRRSDIDKWLENLKTSPIAKPTAKFRLLR